MNPLRSDCARLRKQSGWGVTRLVLPDRLPYRMLSWQTASEALCVVLSRLLDLFLVTMCIHSDMIWSPQAPLPFTGAVTLLLSVSPHYALFRRRFACQRTISTMPVLLSSDDDSDSDPMDTGQASDPLPSSVSLCAPGHPHLLCLYRTCLFHLARWLC